MNKILINQEFHEDIVELVAETFNRSIEEKDQQSTIEQLVREKIDEVYDVEEVKNDIIREVEDMIDSAKSELQDNIDDKINEAMSDKLENIEDDIKNEVRKELPRVLDRALVDRKIDKEQLKEALIELKEDFNHIISEQVKHHFNVLAGFMIDQFKK